MMLDIYTNLFQYGVHDTEITSVDLDGMMIKISFGKGVYLLNDKTKESCLSQPMQLVLKVNSLFETAVNNIELKEFGRKFRYLDFREFKKKLEKTSLGVSMMYYSMFDSCILFECGFKNNMLYFSIDNIVQLDWFFI